ncbi:hypothetical protein M3629_03600 [Paenibacillus polysaccharolyticus]|uniref:hypothetical protein n=1 Tax=Paenibacillus polysaccharolyticus TaxID=582692 RepID=UPI00203BF55F|nr:hypothetical protein [Paenibacillus polysaccharolyticus]MCM3131852.1 hypothetical protein [Paenibacillus polysaccharolyticus]
MGFKFSPYSKQQQLKNNRIKPTAKQRGKISKEVYNAALERSGGYCEKCGLKKHLECAHLIRRWKVEVSTTVNDVAMLCGPSTNTGTCHNIIDYTRKGKEWAEEYREKLYKMNG